jgi:NAD(P)-dependent dehydrogenase (short-subunit alcohol dehydrogenase family)
VYLSTSIVIIVLFPFSSGIGLETCKALASAGCKVILCSRNVKVGNDAVSTEIVQPGLGGYTADSNLIIVKQLDLNSLKSVKEFADDIIKTEPRIDYLILNAGIMALPRREETENRFEKQIGVNHFGHAYLVSLLDSKLRKQDFESRIVVLSSVAHTVGAIDLDDLHFNKGRKYQPWLAYGQSKLANLLYAQHLGCEMYVRMPLNNMTTS